MYIAPFEMLPSTRKSIAMCQNCACKTTSLCVAVAICATMVDPKFDFCILTPQPW